MKTVLLSAAALALTMFVATEAKAAKRGYSGELSAAEEVTPPKDIVADQPQGDVELIFDTETREVCGRFRWYEALTSAPLRFDMHQAPAGMPNADGAADRKFVIPPPAGVTAAPNTVKFKMVFDTSFAASLTKEDQGGAKPEIYGNIHTTKNDKGEIRQTLYRNDDVIDAFDCNGVPTSVLGAAADAGATDAATDAKTTTPTPTGTSGGTSTTPEEEETPPPSDGLATSGGETAAPAKKDSGCNTTGSSGAGEAFAVAIGFGLVLSAMTRKRRDKK